MPYLPLLPKVGDGMTSSKKENTVSTRVDLPASVHKKAKSKAALEGESLKDWLKGIVEKAVR